MTWNIGVFQVEGTAEEEAAKMKSLESELARINAEAEKVEAKAEGQEAQLFQQKKEEKDSKEDRTASGADWHLSAAKGVYTSLLNSGQAALPGLPLPESYLQQVLKTPLYPSWNYRFKVSI